MQRCQSHRLDLFACFPHSWNYRKWASYQESFRGICLWKWDWNPVCSDSVGLWEHWRLCRNPLAISKSRFCLLGTFCKWVGNKILQVVSMEFPVQLPIYIYLLDFKWYTFLQLVYHCAIYTANFCIFLQCFDMKT